VSRILDAIGNTPLVELRHVAPPGSARIVAKLESANPTGSMKDRMARALVEQAAADGRLPPGGTVVEYTAGTTGISLAFAFVHAVSTAHSIHGTARALRAHNDRVLVVAVEPEELGPDATVATIIVDSGLRYLSTDVFRS